MHNFYELNRVRYLEMDIAIQIGNRVKKRREKLGLKLKDFKQYIPELSTTRLSNYEHGTRILPIDIAIKLQPILQV